MDMDLSRIVGIVELAGLESEPALTITRLSAADLPVATGALIVLLDDRQCAVEDLARALRRYPAEHRVRVIERSERITNTTVGEITANPTVDAANPLDAVALVLDPIDLFDVRNAPDGVRGVIDRLRDPVDGCPWDNAQTHESLRPHLLEESYEVLDAIAAGGPAELCEELGDLMMQVVLHAKLAEQAGQFTLDDVSEGIRAKLVRRHPHVFGDGAADTPKLVEGTWEQLKARERPQRESVLDGVPNALPALARAQSILGRAERNGFTRNAALSDNPGGDLGERLLDLVQEARARELSAEDALRDAVSAFERSVRQREAAAAGGP